jgi:hypothetical protein
MYTTRVNRNASRDLYISTTDALLSLPPLQSKSNYLPPEGFIYGKPTVVYNTNPYDRKPVEKVLNGAFAWKGH